MSNLSYSDQSVNKFDLDQSGNIIGYDSLQEHSIGPVETDSNKEKTEAEVLVDLYSKINGYYPAIGYLEFENLPIETVDAMSKYIDKKFEEIGEDNTIFSFRFVEMLLAIGRAFGGKK